ncbi:hypothetical protein HDK77DRAFT_225401 [Phyllosticta capitalensis]
MVMAASGQYKRLEGGSFLGVRRWWFPTGALVRGADVLKQLRICIRRGRSARAVPSVALRAHAGHQLQSWNESHYQHQGLTTQDGKRWLTMFNLPPCQPKKPTMRLLAAGFNGHGQLLSNTCQTVPKFTEAVSVTGGTTIEICWAGWSDVVIRIGLCYYWRGQQGRVVSLGTGCARETTGAPYLHSFFGTHDGCLGAVNTDYSLSLLSWDRASKDDITITTLDRSSDQHRLTRVALIGTDIAISTVHVLNDEDHGTHAVWAFKNTDLFLRFACTPSRRWSRPPRNLSASKIHNVPVKGLYTGQTFCIARTSTSLYSFGVDPRYNCSLGRPTSGPHSEPSTVPSPIVGFSSADGGDIKKVATCQGGHLAAVLTGDGSVYIWGTCGPKLPSHVTTPRDGEQPPKLGVFTRAEAEGWTPDDGPLPIEIAGLPNEHFVDIDVGAAHVVLVERSRGVWVAGDNSLGQLGLGRDSANNGDFLTEFKRVTLGSKERRVRGVTCGWYSTFLLVEGGG